MPKLYFIDDDIWFHGEKQPPRKVYCYNLYHGKDADGNDYVMFFDEDDNAYTLPAERIFEEEV
jgi:hypothetical protein